MIFNLCHGYYPKSCHYKLNTNAFVIDPSLEIPDHLHVDLLN